MIWLRRAFYALVALAAIQVIYYYPQMPEVMASHFDGRGVPNDWAGRSGFFALYLGILLLLVIVFEFTPRWSEKRSRFGMKLPNADYWLSPERIDETRAFFRRQMYLMGSAHLGLTIYVVQLAIMANFEAQPRLHWSVGWALLLYFVVLCTWLIYFFLHFRKT